MTSTAAKYIDEVHRILNFFDRSIEPTAGDRGFGALSCQIKDIDTKRHAIKAVLSSDDEDRFGEVIDPQGFEPFLPRFLENPQLLYCHDHKINLGEWERMEITKHTFEGWAVFDDGDEFAMKIYRKYERKFMRAFSVGFIAHQWRMEEVGVGKQKRLRRRFTLQEPTEGTACTVPANPVALSKALGVADSMPDDFTPQPYSRMPGNTNIDARIEAAVERAIDKRFSTDPGGLMTTLAQDVAELVVAHVGPGADPYGDIPDQDIVPDPEPEDEGEQHQLNAALRNVLGK